VSERNGASEQSERLRAMIYARAHIRTRRVRPTLTDDDDARVRGVYNIVAVCVAAATCVGVGVGGRGSSDDGDEW